MIGYDEPRREDGDELYEPTPGPNGVTPWVEDHAARVREGHSKAMEALGADVHPYSASAIRDWEAQLDEALDALLAERDEARRERDDALRVSGSYHDQEIRDYQQISDLQQRLAQARDALDRWLYLIDIGDSSDDVIDAEAAARAALSGSADTTKTA